MNEEKQIGGITYLPVQKRDVDIQYTNLLIKIMESGKDKKPIHANLKENQGSGHSYAREITNASLSFDLRNGFPIFGHRDLRKIITGAIGEIAGFLNGARTLAELEQFGCPRIFWEKWVAAEKCAVFGLEEGDLGPGSYGPALRAFPTPSEPFDQLAALHEKMKNRDLHMLRTLMITTWIPHLTMGSKEQCFKRGVVVAPCHGTEFHVHLFPERNEMEVTTYQRSMDVPVGGQFNIPQWCTLGLILSMIHGYSYTRYTHHIGTAHIYDCQFEKVRKMINCEAKFLPTVTLEPETPYKNPWDLRKEHFKIGKDYNPNPFFGIPTPI